MSCIASKKLTNIHTRAVNLSEVFVQYNMWIKIVRALSQDDVFISYILSFFLTDYKDQKLRTVKIHCSFN